MVSVSATATEPQTGPIFQFIDRSTNHPVMQAVFPPGQICEAFKQMALDAPNEQYQIPRCSAHRLGDNIPILLSVRYASQGFSVTYRFSELSICEQFEQEFMDTAKQENSGEAHSAPG